MKTRIILTTMALAASAQTTAQAAELADPAGDLLATYTGPQRADLDILSTSATFDGSTFRLTATLAGTPGAAGSLFVFGIDRGAGTPRLTFGSPSVGAGVNFDAVAVLFPDGLGRTAAFPAIGAPTITQLPGAVTLNGNTLTGLFDLSLLPSRGFAPGDYGFTLWSRQRVNPALDGTNAEIADFASVMVSSVPEPSTWALLIMGFGVVGAGMRRRASVAYA